MIDVVADNEAGEGAEPEDPDEEEDEEASSSTFVSGPMSIFKSIPMSISKSGSSDCLPVRPTPDDEAAEFEP